MDFPAATIRRRIRRLTALMCVLAVGWGCGGIEAKACNVPVFRYALERWNPDPYRFTLFHRGPLTDAQQARLTTWRERTDKITVNADLRTVDVDQTLDEIDRSLFAAQANPQLPWLIVQYPKNSRIESTVWAGPLADDTLARLSDSPVRKELIQRLASGQTAVWMILECGDAAKNAAAAAQLESELNQLAGRLELPELTGAPEDNLLSEAPLKIAFSVLRVPRDVAAEQPLVELLLHAEPDLVEFAEPIVFPVFGRGRALLPLIGAGITSENIHQSAEFLVGACSCEIKELNPGFDLLLAADWNALLFNGAPPEELETLSPGANAGEPLLVAIPAGAPILTTAATTDSEASALEFDYRGMEWTYAVLLGLALVAIYSALRVVRR